MKRPPLLRQPMRGCARRRFDPGGNTPRAAPAPAIWPL